MESTSDMTGFRWSFGTNAVFDEARWELTIGGQLAELERKPLEVLLHLLRHAGEVLTKDELLQAVWVGRIVVEASLTNAIVKLRRALGDETQTLIASIPRVGYRLTGAVARKAAPSLPPASVLAAGDPVPRRPNYRLMERLARNEDSEVWRAEQPKIHQERVFKFSLDGVRLSALKREITLSRLLRDALGERPEFATILDWDFDEAPYFIESEFGGQSLDAWLPEHKDPFGRGARLAFMAELADALASAHEVGVLHKDLKPANILVYEAEGSWLPRLVDFGSGRVLDATRLDALNITQLGLTRSQSLSADSGMGTPLYLAPEVIAGQSPSIQSDLYSLGVVLFQLLIGDFRRPLSPGWEANIDDPLLRQDIADFAAGNPAKRPASARELAIRLRTLEERRVQRDLEHAVQARIAASERKLALSRARRPWIAAAMVVLAAGVVASLTYAHRAAQAQRAEAAARVDAERQLAISTALNQFLTVDLLGKAQPEKGGHSKLTVAEAVDMAEPAIAHRFPGQPQVEGAVRSSTADLYATLWELPKAEQQGRLAIGLLQQAGTPALSALVKAEGNLARVLAYEKKFDEANHLLDARLNHPPSGLTDEDWMTVHLQKCRVLDSQHVFKVALRQCKQAQALAQRVPGLSPSVRAAIEQNVGMNQTNTGDMAGALKSLHHAVDLFTQDGGPFHPATLNAKTFLFHALVGSNDPHAAAFGEQLLKDSISIRGPDDLSIAEIHTPLGDAYFSNGDWAKAAKHYAESARIFRMTVGTNVPDYPFTMIGLGESLIYSKEPARALPGLLEAQQLSTKTAKPHDPFVSEIAYDIAIAHLDLGNLAAARAQLPNIERKLDSENGLTNWPMRLLLLDGRLAAAGGDKGTAVKDFQQALALFKGDASMEPEVMIAKQFVAAHPLQVSMAR